MRFMEIDVIWGCSKEKLLEPPLFPGLSCVLMGRIALREVLYFGSRDFGKKSVKHM